MIPFILRPWQKEDLDNLVAMANNKKIARYMTDAFPYPYTREAGIQFIKRNSKAQPVQVMAIVIEDKAAGGIGIFPQTDIMRKNAEMGYWLGEPYWGQGIITRAIKEMTTYAFDTFDIERIYARPFGSNIASQKVLEKAGFILEAQIKKSIYKNGLFEDELIYAIRRKQPNT